MNDKKQCNGKYSVWRCVLEHDHTSLHESYTVSMARLLWTRDNSIVLCFQPRKPLAPLSRKDVYGVRA